MGLPLYDAEPVTVYYDPYSHAIIYEGITYKAESSEDMQDLSDHIQSTDEIRIHDIELLKHGVTQ